MPYSANSELPPAVRSRYSERCQSVFRRAWNADFDNHSDETRAFRIAHTAARNCDVNTQGKAAGEIGGIKISDLPDSAFACVDSSGRHYPHHDASGKVDLPHLRNALSRLAQDDTTTCGASHLREHANAQGVGKAETLDPDERKAWYAGEIARRVRIIPFGGRIPSSDGKGRDFDGEYFDTHTDIKPAWFSERPILWHHGADPTGVMGDTVLGKARNLHMEPDGWWEDFWLNAQESKLERLRRLEERGADLYASSSPFQPPGVRVAKARDGHINIWPHAESTLSTSPQNFLAIVRPAKAVLDDFLTAQIDVLPMAKALAADLDALSVDLTETSLAGDPPAKAGRELSSANIADLRKLIKAFGLSLDELAGWLVERESKYLPQGTKP